MQNRKPRIIISGGGTGGHIFPAIAIANELRRRTDAEILFVGAENRMEMEKVPAAGYRIEGLPVAGFNRSNLLKNLSVIAKLLKSMSKARKIIKDFQPDICVGVGGYASGPVLKAAQKRGIPTLIQEQNSFAGVTNKLLGKNARKICVAYTGMEKFFPADRIILTGNPVRRALLENSSTTAEARAGFGLSAERPTVLAVGGSLGALTINESIEDGLKRFSEAGVQLIWQTGKRFGDRAAESAKGMKGIVVSPFINDMAAAYCAASLVISRAGASSISELELLGKPAVLVPSPNVAEDHQTKNAMALANRGAAVMITDSEARQRLIDETLKLVSNSRQLEEMSRNISDMALRNSDKRIVDEILNIIGMV